MDKEKYIYSKIIEQAKAFEKIGQDKELIVKIERALNLICQAYQEDKKVIFFGNGGSAAQSEHFAAELMGRFKMERKALRALALTANSAILTAIANDYDFRKVFSRQLEGLADEGDIVIGISTSGSSGNVIEGIKTAKAKGAKTIAFTGGKKTELGELVDINLSVPLNDTPQIQEAHLLIGHLLCDLAEKVIFNK